MPSEGDFSAQMSSMRSWLDARGCSPSKFDYDSTGETVIVKVEFGEDREAEAFKERFDGTESDFVKPRNLRFRETMEQVCWWRLTAEEIRAEADEFTSKSARETMAQVAFSYDLMAEDLERRLANQRSRDSWFVAQASALEDRR